MSLFVANQGPKNERLAELMQAVATVYASAFSPEQIESRTERGILDFSEEMGIVIQQAVGIRVGDYFLPPFSGTALSWNDFRWTMNREKLAEHIQLLTLADAFRTVNVQRVETLLLDDIEGLLAVAPGHAEFEWFSADGRAGGEMNFFDESGDPRNV